MSDEKLRSIFDKIDIDRGGTIDKQELAIAFEGAGKKVTESQIDALMKAADVDDSGEISFEEFANILKGVKATHAASTIGKNFRKHASRGGKNKNTTKKAVTEITHSQALDRRSLDKAIGEAMLTMQPKELVQKWDRRQKGAINRIEFRQGVRESLGLNFENKDLDDWFDKFDADGGGTIEEAELKDALKQLQEKAIHDREMRRQLGMKIESLTGKIGMLEELASTTRSALDAAREAAAKLAAHRAAPAVDAKVGEKLNAKLRTEHNEKGVDVDDLYAAWNVAKKVAGWLNGDEFLKHVTTTLTEVTAKRQKSEASKPAVARTSEEREKHLMMTTEEREKAHLSAALQSVGVCEEDVRTQFDALLARTESKAEASADASKHAGMIELRGTLKALMAADPARKAEDARLYDSCSALAAAAQQQQALMKQSLADFVESEKAEAEAAKVRAEAEAKKAEEAKREAAAAKKAASASKQKDVKPAWMQAQPDASAEGAEPGTSTAAAAGSSAAAADSPAPASESAPAPDL